MAQRRNTLIAPHNSPGSLVFWCQRSRRNSTGVNPYGGAKCRWVGLKSATFDKCLAISWKRYKIDAQFLLKSNRKSYALYRMVTLPPPNYPNFYILHRFHIFVMGVVRNFKFRLTVASSSLLRTSHPWKGRGEGHVTHFSILPPPPEISLQRLELETLNFVCFMYVVR